jgi:hypothetical protein
MVFKALGAMSGRIWFTIAGLMAEATGAGLLAASGGASVWGGAAAGTRAGAVTGA